MKDYSYEILDLLEKYKGDEQAALRGENTPWCLYAFSPLRENLFEWLEIGSEDRVLQIGSDYGSVTGLFLRRAKEVVVFDELDENLEVTLRRHGASENLTLVRGGLLPAAAGNQKEYKGKGRKEEEVEILLTEGFDYVILPAALSQVPKTEAKELLSRAAAYVKPGGKLVAAGENEMGVRYLMGAKAFEHAFLQVEFHELFKELEQQQGGTVQIYYPVPDYRYPVSIYSDSYLPKTGDVTNISARLDGAGLWFGNEEKVMADACRNGDFTKVANSFLGMWEKGKA